MSSAWRLALGDGAVELVGGIDGVGAISTRALPFRNPGAQIVAAFSRAILLSIIIFLVDDLMQSLKIFNEKSSSLLIKFGG